MHIIQNNAKQRKKLIRTAACALALVLALTMLPQRAFARTYVINDGGRIRVHTTDAVDPAEVLDEAGLVLGADDTYTTEESVVFSEINVRRNMTVHVDYYGEKMEVRSGGETVRELLRRLNLTFGSGDEISVPLNTRVSDGLRITVSNVVRQEETYTAAMDFEVQRYNDPSMPAGTETVLTQGVRGEMVCTAMVTYVNGEERSRTVLSERVTRQPVNQVVAVGTARSAEPEEDVTYSIDDNTITLSTGEVLTYTDTIRSLATAYCTKGLTATGTQARVGAIAVDPRVIPYGTRMFIVSEDGQYIYGVATAEDTGSPRHIRGTRIDLHYDTKAECVAFGARYCTVYVLG